MFAFRNERYVKELRFTVTASMFVWRSVFDAVGDFINSVPEDKDWCERAWRQGYRIRFAPKSIVGHPARRTMEELKRKWRRLTLESSEGARREGRGPILALLRQSAASACGRAACLPAACLETFERDSKPPHGDRRARPNSRVPLFGSLSSAHAAG